ncbi:MAG TPA: hypothetical protein VJB34_09545 [Bdellovibrionota bacterium]|nr:hypothetical protein [Bdellovibrionota bacterium]
MSRSYKKPWFTDSGRFRKFAKQQANKKVRKAVDVSNGGVYKRFYNSWDICDWKFPWHHTDNIPYWKARRK